MRKKQKMGRWEGGEKKGLSYKDWGLSDERTDFNELVSGVPLSPSRLPTTL